MKTNTHKTGIVLILFALPAAALMSQTLTERITAGRYSVTETASGACSITMAHFGSLTEPGVPALPTKIFYIPLPVNAVLTNVSLSTSDPITIRTDIDVEAAAPLLPTESGTSESSMFADFSARRTSIYTADSPFPAAPLVNHGLTRAGSRPLLKIQFSPLSWNPRSRELQVYETADITVTYTLESDGRAEKPPALPGAANAFSAESAAAGSPVMLVVSSPELLETLAPLVYWREWNQFKVECVSVDEVCASASGRDKAEQIYNYLKSRYFNTGAFDYLLLVGHSDIVPIRKLYPNPANHGYSGEIPSDIYYSDLTCSWDGDGDGFFGEYGDDQINWMPEISVGRIPWSEPDIVADILEKIIAFEKDNTAWKNSSLLVGAMSSFQNENNYSYYYRDTDGAALMELMKKNVFTMMQTTTLYEKAGVSPSEFPCDYPLSGANLQSAWHSSNPACLTWWAHGNSKSAFRKYWRSDNGNNIPENTELMLETFLSSSDYSGDADHQPVIFANACDNGWPEKVSLARGLIRNGSSGIVASSRVSYGTIGWDDVNDGGNASLTYYFWKEFITNARRSGSSLTQARLTYLSSHSTTFYDLQNVYTYNYYGDPATALKPSAPVFGGISGRVTTADGSPAAEIRVLLASDGTVCETDNEGRFLLEIAPAGQQKLTVSENGSVLTEQTVNVTAGRMNETALTLPVHNSVAVSAGVTRLDTEIHENDKKTKTVHVSNTGTVAVSVSMAGSAGSAGWLVPDSAAVSLQPGQQKSISLILDATRLQAGSFAGKLRFTTDPVLDSPLEIPVHCSVIDTMPPSPISDLQLVQQQADTLTLQWTAPGDNYAVGRIDHYEIWSGAAPAAGHTTLTGQKLLDIPTPGMAGDTETAVICPNPFDHPVYIYVKAFDETGKSSLSNTIEAEPEFREHRSWALGSSSIRQTLPEHQTASSRLTFSNTGNVSIDYHLSGEKPRPDWLIYDTASRRLAPDQTDTLVIRFDSEGLDSGLFSASLKLHTAPDPDSTVTIPVTIQVIDTTAPGPITDAVIVNLTVYTLSLAWTAPGDNGYAGIAERYEIWGGYAYAENGLPEDAVKMMDIEAVQASGAREYIDLLTGERADTLYVLVLTCDETGRSSLSNTVAAEPVLRARKSWSLDRRVVEHSITEMSRDTVFLSFANTGTTPIDYRLCCDDDRPDWIAVDETQRHSEPGSLDTLGICFDGGLLDSGVYTSSLTLHTDHDPDSSVSIPVTIHIVDSVPPGPVTDFRVQTQTCDSLCVAWTAPGDNGMLGTAERYELWTGYDGSGEGLPDDAVKLAETVAVHAPGTAELVSVYTGARDQTLYLWLLTFDETGASSLSNRTEAEPVLQEVRSWTLNTARITATVPEASAGFVPLVVTNTGTVSIGYRFGVETGDSWLSLEQPAQDLLPSAADTVLIRLSAETLNQGVYSGLISLIIDTLLSIPVSMQVVDEIDPGEITDLQILTRTQDSLLITWTAPGDNGMDRQVQRYEIRSGTLSMTGVSGHQGRVVMTIGDPLPPGGREQRSISAALLSGDAYLIIRALDEAGNGAYSNELSLQTTGVGGGFQPSLSLRQNYPNPFNCETTIEFSIAEPGQVLLSVHNELGQTIAVLADRVMQSGEQSVAWNGRDRNGTLVPSGIYFYRIRTSRGSMIKKMLLLK
ncbi:carboxypeptidase regulatory-like domain-containing protein [bacterium]|nr:carboxypeptidase regulatory-like domain-containing protein [bacterium]